jgi:hypothetical protein
VRPEAGIYYGIFPGQNNIVLNGTLSISFLFDLREYFFDLDAAGYVFLLIFGNGA